MLKNLNACEDIAILLIKMIHTFFRGIYCYTVNVISGKI